MASLYLWLNAVLYAAFAIWMTLAPQTTSKAVGYLTLSNSGRSEFLVVYGGLQFGLAAFFAWTAYSSARHGVGVWFALCLYAPIVLYRIITIVRFWPVEPTTLVVGALEVLLLIAAGLLALFLKA